MLSNTVDSRYVWRCKCKYLKLNKNLKSRTILVLALFQVLNVDILISWNVMTVLGSTGIEYFSHYRKFLWTILTWMVWCISYNNKYYKNELLIIFEIWRNIVHIIHYNKVETQKSYLHLPSLSKKIDQLYWGNIDIRTTSHIYCVQLNAFGNMQTLIIPSPQ